ncbi:MAG: biotin--[Clostridia bacterium]|nr:biotin--[acetyl-CoA-carboxylase] ligase [Clostridia bacterium]
MDEMIRRLSQEEYVSGEQLAQEMQLSRSAVWKRIEQARENGWEIVSGGKKGYHLETGDRLEPELWVDALTTDQIGRGDILYADTLDSTNVQLKRMALEGSPHGSLALCERQHAGRGRLGRQWVSVKGQGLLQSVLLRPDILPRQVPMVTYVVALSMAEAVKESAGAEVRIKWPNDLVLGDKKICGILNEAGMDMDRVDWIVCGVGLNVFEGAVPEELRHQATSLDAAVVPPRRREIFVSYLRFLEKNMVAFEKKGWSALEKQYRELSCTLGKHVRVVGTEEFEGTAEDMQEDGGLLVRRQDGSLTCVYAGDVSVRGVMGYV